MRPRYRPCWDAKRRLRYHEPVRSSHRVSPLIARHDLLAAPIARASRAMDPCHALQLSCRQIRFLVNPTSRAVARVHPRDRQQPAVCDAHAPSLRYWAVLKNLRSHCANVVCSLYECCRSYKRGVDDDALLSCSELLCIRHPKRRVLIELVDVAFDARTFTF